MTGLRISKQEFIEKWHKTFQNDNTVSAGAVFIFDDIAKAGCVLLDKQALQERVMRAKPDSKFFGGMLGGMPDPNYVKIWAIHDFIKNELLGEGEKDATS